MNSSRAKKNLVPLVGPGHLHPGCGGDLMEPEIQSRQSGHKQNDENRDCARASCTSWCGDTRGLCAQQWIGFRDRDVPMTPKLLAALREYWRWKRPKDYLFPSTEGHRGIEQPICDHTIWYICSEAAKRAGIKKRIGAHTLRHSFATSLMESGTDLRTIQLLMGHAHLEHTTRYLHMSQRHLHAAPNPLDQITVSSQRFSRMRPDDYQA